LLRPVGAGLLIYPSPCPLPVNGEGENAAIKSPLPSDGRGDLGVRANALTCPYGLHYTESLFTLTEIWMMLRMKETL
jgi:hypothetical protein